MVYKITTKSGTRYMNKLKCRLIPDARKIKIEEKKKKIRITRGDLW